MKIIHIIPSNQVIINIYHAQVDSFQLEGKNVSVVQQEQYQNKIKKAVLNVLIVLFYKLNQII